MRRALQRFGALRSVEWRGDRTLAVKALTVNPLVGGEVARPLLEAMLEAGREHMERFASV